MLRKRERFERTDVPRYNPLRPYISLAVIAVIAIASYLLVTSLWHKANQMNALNDGYLDDALYDQLSTRDPREGLEESDDSFSNVLVLIVDDIDADPRTLQGAQLLVRNMTARTATIASLPLNTKMLAGESNVVLTTYFDYAGAEAVIAPLTDAANVHVSHVIVASDKIWDQLERLEGPTLKALLSRSTNDLATIASDYRTGELVALADYLREVGFDNIRRIDAPVTEDTLGDGTAVSVISQQDLCLDLGIFIDPNASAATESDEAAPAEGEGEAESSEGEVSEGEGEGSEGEGEGSEGEGEGEGW